ncbi:MAG: 16S rRNA (cytosine(967)-C(5))-methyltransferase RsmB [Proteobacteria bacterium]|jgi:16S rRNA (cytosine967-C5)-methyltransferase|nr:16S rRNA (cytosine(967)-C(5))-methyltransferase RsmB [Pseudomonadota bacterium]
MKPEPAPLKPDSLAYAFLHAAKLVASVLEGSNLTECYERGLRQNPGWNDATRGAVRDMAWSALREYGRGDAILRRFLVKPLPVSVHALLLIAVYRLEQRPEQTHTVVDQAVDAAAHLAAGLKGVVNGVLRNIVRQRAKLAAWRDEDIVARYAYPAWWIERVQREHGKDWEAILAAGNLHPPMSLRVNRRRSTVESYLSELADAGIDARRLDNDALLLTHPLPVSKLPGFAEGKVSVQDAGAQWAAPCLGVCGGERVLDACAAPGGKGAHLLELADIELTALELDPMRTERMRDNFARLGLSARIVVADCRALDAWWDGRPFDCILADVPCSASGVVRRHPDIKWLRRKKDIAGFVVQQASIIDALWQTLANGGIMLYATCSVFDDENQRQIKHFLVRHPDAELFMPRTCRIPPLLPTSDHDGFYYACLRKTTGHA